VKAPPENFESAFFGVSDRVRWLEEAYGGSIPPMRLVRTGNHLFLESSPELDARSHGRAALAVQRLLDRELDGDFLPQKLDVPAGDWDR
jgi:hypothetical protein